MTRRTLIAIGGGVLIFAICFLVLILGAANAAKKMARGDTVQSGINSLGICLETYRDDHGKYPSSLTELVSESDPERKNHINRVLHDSFHDTYEYQPLKNGFVITVTGPNSWFIKWDRIEKKYKIGEALK
jgi:hypothetical protein